MRFLIYFFSALLVFWGTAQAQPITLKHGIGTDTWTTWPEPAEWTKARFIDKYPEWRGLATAAQLRSIKAAGFDHVRLTADPGMFLWKPTAAKNKRLLASLHKAIDAILAANSNVIVDMHTIPRSAGQSGTEAILATTASFSRYLAVVDLVGRSIAKYAPARVAFEPINEPTIDCPWDQPKTNRWPAMAQKLHATARAAAPKLTIIIQGACWGESSGLAKLTPSKFNDSNIIWSFHSYDPMIFSHQGASWTEGPERFVHGLTYPPAATEKATTLQATLSRINSSSNTAARKAQLRHEATDALDDYFDPAAFKASMNDPVTEIAAWSARHNIPASRIFVGEFGAIRADLANPVPAESRKAYLAAAAKRFRAKGWSWSVWNWTGSFGIDTHDGSRTADASMARALGTKP